MFFLYSLLYLSITKKSILILRWCKAPVFLANCCCSILPCALTASSSKDGHKTVSWTSREEFVCGDLSEQGSGTALRYQSLPPFNESGPPHSAVKYAWHLWHIRDNVRYISIYDDHVFICFYHLLLSFIPKLCQAYCHDGSLLKPRGQLLGHRMGEDDVTTSRCRRMRKAWGRHGEDSVSICLKTIKNLCQILQKTLSDGTFSKPRPLRHQRRVPGSQCVAL